MNATTLLKLATFTARAAMPINTLPASRWTKESGLHGRGSINENTPAMAWFFDDRAVMPKPLGGHSPNYPGTLSPNM